MLTLFKRELTTKIHMASASEKYALIFTLSAGNCHDAPEGRCLLKLIYSDDVHYLLMGIAYEDNETRRLAEEQNFIPVVLPKKNRFEPWIYDKELYKSRNQIERLFLRIKRFRKVFTCYDKLDIIYSAVVSFALILNAVFM